MLLPLLLIPVLYVVMIRPQQKRQKQWQQMLGGIKAGDKVTTAGGIRGTIISIKDDGSSSRYRTDQDGSGKDRDRPVTTEESPSAS
jgi:preprotein translocase subunit YajC